MATAITSEVVTVTPAMAKAWLDENNYDDNRHVAKSRVDFYARQMKNKRWSLNGEAIIFDQVGKLLNGQHRLHGCIQAGVSFQSVIVRGVQTESFSTMDQGYTRSAGQILQMKDHKNATVRAAICRTILAWELAQDQTLRLLSTKLSPDEILLVQDCYPEEIDAAVDYLKYVRRIVPARTGVFGLAHVLFRRARPRKAVEFFRVLDDGATSNARHPALVLRNRIINDKMRDRTLDNIGQWCLFAKAWNTYDKGDDTRALIVRKDAEGHWVYPTVRGLKKNGTAGVSKVSAKFAG